jgi:hypothetical protein
MIREVNGDQQAGPGRLAEQAGPVDWVPRLAGRARGSPYYPALAHPLLRRVLRGAAMSALGDGMSAVAIAWLALKLAPEASRGLWVGARSRPTRFRGGRGGGPAPLAGAWGSVRLQVAFMFGG